MEKVKFGIIGAGNQGTYYAQQLFKKGEVKNGILVAVCDSNGSNVRVVKRVFTDNRYVFTKGNARERSTFVKESGGDNRRVNGNAL